MRIQGQTSIITGGASGIGEAIVRRFVDEGSEVCIADINLEGANRLAAELGDAAWAIHVDVRDEASVKQVADAAMDRWGRVDVLVNNAGAELNKAYDEVTEDEWDLVIDTDLKGPWLFTKHVVPHMVAAGSGSAIYIASLNGLVGFPLASPYGGSKHGLVGYVKHVAIELAQSGVRFNCVCPGVIQTPMMERWTQLMPDQEEAQEMLRGMMPIGRMGRPEEIAGAVLFFATEDSSLCQGSILAVDGGWVAQ
ncbi:SDR family NAD(P)-dependent oxidoreductase [Candidatus Poriferisocius sp.]|uniref:SDR family NAD(P)-dependent oxidoreductase n=1 Tax=Candidatus Poriferisocius sp. TaxID=3101276 RepID=UPI003B5A3E1C